MVLIMLFSLRDTTTLSFRPSASRGNGCVGVRAVIRPTCFQGPSENAATSHVLIPRLRKSGTKSNINAPDSISSNHRKCKNAAVAAPAFVLGQKHSISKKAGLVQIPSTKSKQRFLHQRDDQRQSKRRTNMPPH